MKYFGTDGLRGIVNKDLTIELLQKMCDDFDYAFKHVEASFNYYESSLNFFRKY